MALTTPRMNGLANSSLHTNELLGKRYPNCSGLATEPLDLNGCEVNWCLTYLKLTCGPN